MGQVIPLLRCRCCSGTGVVEASTGKMRPCSRCRAEDFGEWYGLLVRTHFKEKAARDGEAT